MIGPIALIGFGEAGAAFAGAGRWRGARAFDILPERRAAMRDAGVYPCATLEEAVVGSPLVLSLVTAHAAREVAERAAEALDPSALFCDMNSVAPETKRRAAEAFERACGRYVDAAIMAPVEPARLGVPVLLSGAPAHAAVAALEAAGFRAVRAAGSEVGQASAIKMLRSIVVKGVEALTWEMMAGAARAGVAQQVLASLDESERSVGWAQRAAYNLERMERHGLRRAAEMEEVARTLKELGVEPVMTRATAQRQRTAAAPAQERGT